MRTGVVLFPGMNCEHESLRALQSVGVEAEVVRSNERKRLESFDGYLLPGGFSFEDRIRAGVVAANQPAMEIVARAVDAGKPVAGICNGAQILLEAGLVPGIRPGRVDMALALNDAEGRVGYYCDWRWVTGDLFAEPVPLPFAHAEGRFVTHDAAVKRTVLDDGLIAARYCRRSGRPADGWPTNPNGAWESVAALTNRGGHVIAIMPHPERANWAYQVPPDLGGEWGERKRRDVRGLQGEPGPGRVFFERFRDLLRRAAA